MAMSKQTDSLLEESEEFLFICGICLYNFDNPKALPCLHTFCCECIRQWAAHGSCTGIKGKQASAIMITCPNCRREAPIPQGGVDQLPTNFYIPLLPKQTSIKLPTCMSCANPEGAESEIKSRCKDCGWLCQSCLVSHKSLKALKEHDVFELDNLRSGKTAPTVLASRASTSHKGGEKCGVWKHEKKFGNFKEARCVAIASNGDIAVTEESTKGKVHVFSKEGKPKFVLDTTIDLLPGKTSRPYGVAVDVRGYFYVTDLLPWVRVYSNVGNYLFLFQTFPPESCDSSKSDLKCMGIAISHKQLVFVCESTFGCISVHKADGTHIRTFKSGLHPPQFLSLIGNTIAISKRGGEYVKLLDIHNKFDKKHCITIRRNETSY